MNVRLLFLGKRPTWHTILFYVFISILYMFRVTSCSSSGESIVSIQHLVYVIPCRWPCRVQAGKFLPDLHTKRSPTHSDIHQMLYWYNWFWWWWARGCSKHVENWNKYIEKNCASNWSFTKNRNKMHGKKNIKFCTCLVLCRLRARRRSAHSFRGALSAQCVMWKPQRWGGVGPIGMLRHIYIHIYIYIYVCVCVC